MVRLAPVNIPFARRMQTLAVLTWAMLQPICITLTIYLLLNPFTTVFMLLYIGFILFIDKAPVRGGRRFKFARNFFLWKLFRDYFPISLEKTVDLDPSKNYVFAYHPHGIISIGAFGNFGTDVTGFADMFPGITLRLLTLSINFKIPFFREYVMAQGLCDVGRDSINNILRKGPGHSVMIVVGGAKESLDARPKTYDLTLAERKGFVKLALVNGAALVPVFAFGETDVYEQVDNPEGSRTRRIQMWLQHKMGFALPLFNGRGVFNYDWGLLPRRTPIRAIVGAPIEVPKVASPTDEQVTEYHKKYMTALKDLFDSKKDIYARDRKKSIEFKK